MKPNEGSTQITETTSAYLLTCWMGLVWTRKKQNKHRKLLWGGIPRRSEFHLNVHREEIGEGLVTILHLSNALGDGESRKQSQKPLTTWKYQLFDFQHGGSQRDWPGVL